MSVSIGTKLFQPSAYQQEIFDWHDENVGKGKHLIVEAVAGSGKTTTGLQQFKHLPDGLDVAFVAFNKNIADEMRLKLPAGSNARTYHSLGLATIKKTVPDAKVDSDKVEKYLKRVAPNKRWLYYPVEKLVGLCKSTGNSVFGNDDLERICLEHNIDLKEEEFPEMKYEIFDLTQKSLSYSMTTPEIVDFDDMIWLPNVLDSVSFYQYDYLFVDEVQDTNAAQLFLAVHSIHKDGTICGVGDRKQSIYRFRGADETAMDSLKEALGAQELPLSISYRCPVAIRVLVNTKFPNIKFEVPEWAVQGQVRDIKSSESSKELQVNDMVLCRVNADLVPLCFSLIRNGTKATIKGRDIGKGLVDLIKKSHATYVPDLVAWVDRWEQQETEKALKLGMSGSKLQFIRDKFDTLYALTEGADLVSEVISRCETMFSDERAGIMLSTIHRAKGLEADRVFILRPDLLPHPAAKSPADQASESNLEYVAITRAKKELIYMR